MPAPPAKARQGPAHGAREAGERASGGDMIAPGPGCPVSVARSRLPGIGYWVLVGGAQEPTSSS